MSWNSPWSNGSAATPASQVEAEAGTETAIRSWSPLRVFQAIAAKVAASIATLTLAYSSTVKSTQTVDSTGKETHVITDGTTTATVRIAPDGTLTIDQGSRQIALRCDATTDGPVYGPELLTSAEWTVGAGWAESPDDTFAHTAGSVEALTHSATITSGTLYQIAWTITGRTAGGVVFSVGGQSQSSTASESFGPRATSTAALAITPTTDFNGTLSLVSLRAIITGSAATLSVKNAAGTVIYEERASGTTNTFSGVNAGQSNTTGFWNTFSGVNAGRNNTTGNSNTFSGFNAGLSNTTGSSNTFSGLYAGYSNTTGGNNTFSGFSAGQNNTTGSSNTFSGVSAGYSNTTGNSNTFSGNYAGYNNTTGGNNTFSGTNAGFSNTTGSYNTFSGYNAGRNNTTGNSNTFSGYAAGLSNTTGSSNTFSGLYAGYSNTTGNGNTFSGESAGCYCADGTTPLTDPESSVYIGNNTRGFDNNDNNSVVIGVSAIGAGANTTVIGTSATTSTRIFGALLAGNSTSTATSTNGVTLGSAASNAIASSLALGAGTTAGVNQTGIFVLGKTTANTTPTVLDILDTATNRPVIPAKAAWHFRAMCIAYGPTYKTSAWSIEGVIVRDGSNDTRIVGTPTVALIAQDAEMSGCAVAATADNTNESLAITVTGLAATSIRWTCTTFYSQTIQA